MVRYISLLIKVPMVHMISTKYSPIRLEAFCFAQVQNSFLQSALQL